MKKQLGSAAAVLLFVLVAGVPLSGQSYRSFQEEYDAIREQSKLRVGPLRLVPLFRLSEAGYDSNVYFREDEGEVVRDVTATLSHELRGYWLAGSSVIVSVTENPEYLAFAREKALRAFSNNFSAGLRWLLLRSFSLSAGYHSLSHVRRALSDLDHRIRDTSTGGTASLFFETARGTAIGVTGAVDDFRYKDVASGAPDDIYGRALDRRETSAAAEVYYRVFSRSYFFSTVGWTRYEFSHPESAWRDASSIEASAGFRFPLAGRARGKVVLGWKSFRPDAAGRRAFSGLVTQTEVSLRAGRLGLTLGFDRDNAFSYIESAYYYVDARARAGLSLYLFRGLRIDGGIQYGTMSFPEPQEIWVDGATVVIDGRKDVQRNLSVGPVFRISGTVGVGLTYNWYGRTSNAPGFDVRRNFIGAFITYEF
jgi:Putative beta-barrel porin 2